jgi:YegS/Rv2252/BmrU family lipid kinase
VSIAPAPTADAPAWSSARATAARRVAIIVNTGARRGDAEFASARDGLAAAGLVVAAAVAVRKPSEFAPALRKLIDAGHDVIAVGGGDGTLASAAAIMAGQSLVMAILPLGTANSFARSLGIPTDLPGAIAVIAAGATTGADVIRIGDRHFLNTATIGVPARIAQDIPPWLKRWFGRFGYLGYALVKLARLEAFEARVSIAGSPDIVEQVVEIRIANGAYVGGAHIVDGASPESRDVTVELVRGSRVAALAGVWAANLAGVKPAPGKVRRFRAVAFDLSCTPEQPISVDGETGSWTPVSVRVAPGALNVIVPGPQEPPAGRA